MIILSFYRKETKQTGHKKIVNIIGENRTTDDVILHAFWGRKKNRAKFDKI